MPWRSDDATRYWLGGVSRDNGTGESWVDFPGHSVTGA